MITIERVKQLLNDPLITDEIAEEIRSGFQALVEDVVYPKWLEERNKIKEKIINKK